MIALPIFRGVLSGFSPLSLAPALWLDAESLSGSDGTQISTWADRSGNSHDATQATSANQPKLYNSVINGKKVVRFDSSDDRLDCVAFAISQPFDAFAVFSAAASTTVKQVLADATTSTSSAMVHRAAASNNSGMNQGTGFFPIATTTSWQILRTLSNGVDSEVSRNGTAASVGNAGTNTTAQFRIGNTNAGNDGLNGDIAEILVFPTALSATNRQRVERYLGAKYGITV